MSLGGAPLLRAERFDDKAQVEISDLRIVTAGGRRAGMPVSDLIAKKRASHLYGWIRADAGEVVLQRLEQEGV